MLALVFVLVPAHAMGRSGWHWENLVTAALIVIAIVSVALVLTGWRQRHVRAKHHPSVDE